MNYRVTNLMNGDYWQGDARDAKEAYCHINVKAGDTTFIAWGRTFGMTAIKEWNKDSPKALSQGEGKK